MAQVIIWISKVCHSCGHHWDYNPGALSLSQATAAHLKIGHPRIADLEMSCKDLITWQVVTSKGYRAHALYDPFHGCIYAYPGLNALTRRDIYVYAITYDSETQWKCLAIANGLSPLTWWWLPSQIAKFIEPTWGPPGSCRPQMGSMLAPWTLLSGLISLCGIYSLIYGLIWMAVSLNLR